MYWVQINHERRFSLYLENLNKNLSFEKKHASVRNIFDITSQISIMLCFSQASWKCLQKSLQVQNFGLAFKMKF